METKNIRFVAVFKEDVFFDFVNSLKLANLNMNARNSNSLISNGSNYSSKINFGYFAINIISSGGFKKIDSENIALSVCLLDIGNFDFEDQFSNLIFQKTKDYILFFSDNKDKHLIPNTSGEKAKNFLYVKDGSCCFNIEGFNDLENIYKSPEFKLFLEKQTEKEPITTTIKYDNFKSFKLMLKKNKHLLQEKNFLERILNCFKEELNDKRIIGAWFEDVVDKLIFFKKINKDQKINTEINKLIYNIFTEKDVMGNIVFKNYLLKFLAEDNSHYIKAKRIKNLAQVFIDDIEPKSIEKILYLMFFNKTQQIKDFFCDYKQKEKELISTHIVDLLLIHKHSPTILNILSELKNLDKELTKDCCLKLKEKDSKSLGENFLIELNKILLDLDLATPKKMNKIKI